MADPATVTADAVMARMALPYRQRAAAGDARARAALEDSAYWAALHNAVRQLARPGWPANVEHTRHDAYVTARAAQHPSGTADVPFELSRARGTDNDVVVKELAVIGAVLNDPARARRFRYTPSPPDASPYGLRPQDFADPSTAEIWDALVTGPDPAIALPAATDPHLAPEQRTAAMIQPIATRLDYNDYHRCTGSEAAKARLDARANQLIAAYLTRASAPDYSPNPDHAAEYAVSFVLEPSIPAVVEDLAGRVRDHGLSDAPLGQIALELSTTEYALDQLAERLRAAPRSLTIPSTPEHTAPAAPQEAGEQPSYTSRPTERRVLISLLQDPGQLRDGPARSLAAQDFTQPEHAYLFKALRSLRPHAARDPWLLTDQANKLAHYDGAPALDPAELSGIGYAARTLKVPPAGQAAGHLITLTVRRTAREASTVARAAARTTRDPRALIDHSRTQFQQATREALRYHARSVPEPAPHGTRPANIA